MLTIGPVEKFKDHSQFKDLKDFNQNIEMFLAVHKKDFTKSEYMLFKRLTKFCAKVAGIATASIKTILEGNKLKDFVMGASESTFQRMKRKAIKLGILEVKTTNRKNSSTSTNLWIFKRFVPNSATIDTPQTQGEQAEAVLLKGKVFRQLTPLKTSITSKANKQSINKRIGNMAIKNGLEITSLDHSFTSDRVPKEFVTTVKPFFDDKDTIEEYWNVVQVSSYDYRNTIDSDTVLSMSMHSFKQMIGRVKKGTVEKPIAYFTGVLKRQLEATSSELLESDSTANRKDIYTLSERFKEFFLA